MESLKVTDFVSKENVATINVVSANYIEYVIGKKDDDDEMYTFSVPREDMGTGVFNVVEKSILLMRWIRKGIEDGSMVKFQEKALAAFEDYEKNCKD